MGAEAGNAEGAGEPDSIRDLQRRRREAARVRAGIEAVLAVPQEQDQVEEEAPPGPAPAKVYIVFRGVQWDDPSGVPRESDSIAGVYGTEEAARRAALAVSRESAGADAWYQPYTVE